MFKRIMVAVAFGLMAIAAQAEATFDQIQTLIQQQQYAAAASGLEGIIANHPKSAKAFYAMAQAQAGLGNFDKAHKALDIATGLNPTLDFAPASSVASLRQAITPQTAKIEAVETSHFWRNFAYFALFAGFGVACYFLYSVYKRKEEEDAREQAEEEARIEARVKRMQAQREAEEAELARQLREQAERDKAEAALKAHKNYGKPGFDPTNPDKLKTKAQIKKEEEASARIMAEAEAIRQRQRAEAAEEDARRERARAAATPTQTVVHTNNGGNDMLTGVLIGNMLSSSHHDHHSHDTTVIRETVREVPAPSRDTSWDDTPAKAAKSSWDDAGSSSSSSSRSSSWDDDSSSRSSSSSSWSSSSSDSSSSWSSSSSDSGSSSSWD